MAVDVHRWNSSIDRQKLEIERLGGRSSQFATDTAIYLLYETSLFKAEIHSPNVDNRSLSVFQKMHDVRFVDLSGTRITTKGVRQLAASCKDVTNLNVSNTLVGADVGQEVVSFPWLWGLYLNDTHVTDKTAQNLSTMTRLRVLSLAGTQMGDEGLLALAQLPELQWLCIDATNVTDAGRAEFQRQRPDVNVWGRDEMELWVNKGQVQNFERAAR